MHDRIRWERKAEHSIAEGGSGRGVQAAKMAEAAKVGGPPPPPAGNLDGTSHPLPFPLRSVANPSLVPS